MTQKKIKQNSNYVATTDGKILNILTGKVNEGGYNRRYLRCKIGGKGYSVHRIIAETLIPNPDNKPQVNHINGDKHDNRVENLEWVTAYENNLHARTNGLALGPKSGTNSNLSKLDNDTLEYINSIHKPFDKEFGTKALAKQYGVNNCWLATILNGNKKHRPSWN
jgi:hypothetical protein